MVLGKMFPEDFDVVPCGCGYHVRSEARSAGWHHVTCRQSSARSSFFRPPSVGRLTVLTVCARFLVTEPTPCRSRAWSSSKLTLNRPPSCARWLAGKSDWSRVDPSLRDSLLPPALLFLILSLRLSRLFLACSVFFLLPHPLHFIQTLHLFTHHSGSLCKLSSLHHHLRHFTSPNSTHRSRPVCHAINRRAHAPYHRIEQPPQLAGHRLYIALS